MYRGAHPVGGGERQEGCDLHTGNELLGRSRTRPLPDHHGQRKWRRADLVRESAGGGRIFRLRGLADRRNDRPVGSLLGGLAARLYPPLYLGRELVAGDLQVISPFASRARIQERYRSIAPAGAQSRRQCCLRTTVSQGSCFFPQGLLRRIVFETDGC